MLIGNINVVVQNACEEAGLSNKELTFEYSIDPPRARLVVNEKRYDLTRYLPEKPALSSDIVNWKDFLLDKNSGVFSLVITFSLPYRNVIHVKEIA